MTIELIKCPHCGYKYKTDVEKVVKDGETVVVLVGFSDTKDKLRRKTAKS